MTDTDKLAREAIHCNTDRNIFVEAGAGSGKTTELVERMTALVISGTDISRICALTFTKAAAREFYSRFQLRLSEIAAGTEDSTVKERCRSALDNIDLCFMGTIDSFSELILKEHPVEAGLRSDFTVTEDSSIPALCRQAIKSIAGGEYGTDLLDSYIRLKSVSFQEPEDIFSALVKKHGDLIYTDILIPDYERNINKAFADKKQELMQVLDCLMNHPEAAYTGKGKEPDPKYPNMLADFGPAYKRLQGNWSECFKDISRYLKGLDLYRINCPPEELGIKRTDLFEPLKTPKGTYKFVPKNYTELTTAINDHIYCTALEFFASAMKELTRRNIANGRLTFTDAKYILRDMLKNDASKGGRLIRHIRERHSIFLTDEFQDTDPVQSEILFYITAEKPDPDVSKCVPVQGSLFIVGDPKQSIYRFRGADIKAYMSIRERFAAEGGEVLGLTRNFRSTAKLKTVFNEAFEKLMPESTDYQSSFPAIPIETEDDPAAFTGVFTYSPSDDDAETVAELIKSIAGGRSRLVPDPKTKKLRPIEYRDIMVILPVKTRINKYLAAFRAAGIPCFAEGGSTMDKCTPLIELSKILSALAAPGNSLAVFRAVTCGCFGITEGELSETLPELTLYSDKSTGSERIDKAISALRELLKASRSILPSALFGRLINELKILRRVRADELECLCFARELLRSTEVSGEVSSLNDAADMLAELLVSKPERTLLFELTANSVQIANLHKVKGLERNIVILADALGKSREPDRNVLRRGGRAESCIFKCLDDNFIPIVSTNTYFTDRYEDELKAAAAEGERLLYVAATRARSVLIISDAKGSRGSINKWEFLMDYAEGSLEYTAPGGTDTLEEVSASVLCESFEDPFDNADVKQKSYSLILPSKVKVKTKAVRSDSETGETEEPETEKKQNAALIGTLVHRLMERFVTVQFKAERAETVKAVLADIGADESYSEMLEGVFDAVMSGGFRQENDFPADIRSELAGAETYCEVPFCYMRSTELCNGVIDLLFRKNGRLFIVDYKTTAETENLDENYSSQLAEYKAAVKQLLGEDAEAYIYHIDV